MRREGPEGEPQDRIRDAAREHPASLLPNQFRLGHRLGSEDRSHPGKFPVLDDAHKEWRDAGAIRISRTGLGFSAFVRSGVFPGAPAPFLVERACRCVTFILFEQSNFLQIQEAFSKTRDLFDGRAQTDKYHGKFPHAAPLVTRILSSGRPHSPPTELDW